MCYVYSEIILTELRRWISKVMQWQLSSDPLCPGKNPDVVRWHMFVIQVLKKHKQLPGSCWLASIANDWALDSVKDPVPKYKLRERYPTPISGLNILLQRGTPRHTFVHMLDFYPLSPFPSLCLCLCATFSLYMSVSAPPSLHLCLSVYLTPSHIHNVLLLVAFILLKSTEVITLVEMESWVGSINVFAWFVLKVILQL